MCNLHKIMPGLSASEDGRIYLRGVEVKQYKGSNGYMIVSPNRKILKVARLVGIAFLKEVNGKNEINHIDGIKGNNFVTNLEWCTRSENMKHAYDNGLHPKVSFMGADHPSWMKRGILHQQSMSVVASKEGQGFWFGSQCEAARYGFKQSSISRCINGKKKTHKGYTWQPIAPIEE